MKFTKLTYTLLAAMTLAGIAAPTTVSFASTGNSTAVRANSVNTISDDDPITSITHESEELLAMTNEQAEYMDQFVFVKNGQYYLDVPSDVQIDHDLIAATNQHLSDANLYLRRTGYYKILDPVTKAIEIEDAVIGKEARSISGVTVIKSTWWYSRYLMKTSAAVENMHHYLVDWSLGLAGGVAVAGWLSPGAGVVLGLGSVYYGKMAEDLSHVHTLHPSKQLYMDVNKVGGYTIAVYN